MNWLFENPVPIWMGGAVLVTLAGVVFLQVRSTRALLGIVAAVMLTASLLVVEWLVVTPREAVEQTLYQLLAAVEANDLPRVLRFISPQAADVRSDAEAIMPQFQLAKARVVGSLEITLDPSGTTTEANTEAVAQFRALVDGTHGKTGMKGAYFDKLTVTFQKEGDQWLVKDYTPTKDWQRALTR